MKKRLAILLGGEADYGIPRQPNQYPYHANVQVQDLPHICHHRRSVLSTSRTNISIRLAETMCPRKQRRSITLPWSARWRDTRLLKSTLWSLTRTPMRDSVAPCLSCPSYPNRPTPYGCRPWPPWQSRRVSGTRRKTTPSPSF